MPYLECELWRFYTILLTYWTLKSRNSLISSFKSKLCTFWMMLSFFITQWVITRIILKSWNQCAIWLRVYYVTLSWVLLFLHKVETPDWHYFIFLVLYFDFFKNFLSKIMKAILEQGKAFACYASCFLRPIFWIFFYRFFEKK